MEQKKFPEMHAHFIDKLALGNAFLSGITLFPQLFKAMWVNDFSQLSAVTFFLIFVNGSIWLLYALHRNLISLAIASFFNITAAGLILIFVLIAG